MAVIPFKPKNKEQVESVDIDSMFANNTSLIYDKALELAVSAALNEEDFDNIISVGAIGLIKAIQGYKFDKGITFEVYALRCIENEMLMYLRTKYGSGICIPTE